MAATMLEYHCCGKDVEIKTKGLVNLDHAKPIPQGISRDHAHLGPEFSGSSTTHSFIAVSQLLPLFLQKLLHNGSRSRSLVQYQCFDNMLK